MTRHVKLIKMPFKGLYKDYSLLGEVMTLKGKLMKDEEVTFTLKDVKMPVSIALKVNV